jgi:hypothetical protein
MSSRPHVVVAFSALVACSEPVESDLPAADGESTAVDPSTDGTAATAATTPEPGDTSSTAPDDEGGDSTTSSPPVCGDATCDADETCDSCPEDCAPCEPIPCDSEGGVYCGGNGVGGDPQTLYVCEGGALQVLEHCRTECSYMPLGIPDRCASAIDVPPPLIDLLDAVPYVEQDCSPVDFPDWPYSAQQCTYTSSGITTDVIVANPDPEVVGAWIVDASAYIPALAGLRDVDAAAYEQGLAAIGLHMLYQSSRIFPLEGGIVEDLGGGGAIYPFSLGVSDPCSDGCYCRINSLHREEWCGYRAALGDDYDGCIAEVGASGHTPEWAGHCLDNHIAAWTSTANEHFRAKAYLANAVVEGMCGEDGSACSPAQIVDAVESAYGL